MELEVFEILERFENITSKNERVAYLREQSIPALKDVVRGCFDESLEFLLPAGTPPYTPNKPESTPSSLRKLHNPSAKVRTAAFCVDVTRSLGGRHRSMYARTSRMRSIAFARTWGPFNNKLEGAKGELRHGNK